MVKEAPETAMDGGRSKDAGSGELKMPGGKPLRWRRVRGLNCLYSGQDALGEGEMPHEV